MFFGGRVVGAVAVVTGPAVVVVGAGAIGALEVVVA
jgi:hypothetical protein